MLGRLEFAPGSRSRGAVEDLYGMKVFHIQTDPAGRWGGYRLNRAGAALRRCGAGRVLLPKGFMGWDMLNRFGLRPVDPTPLLHACAPELAEERLRRRDIDPAGATVALAGNRADGAMARAAMGLCPRVRRLVIRAHGGEKLALHLWERYGIPILPPEEPAHLEVNLGPGGQTGQEPGLTLYGLNPDLGGGGISFPALNAEDREDIPLLCALWEGGRLDVGGLKFT